uniref:Uncharacterized protein n=1 Tax=Anguilla anguilla TaxID=7936 RepID=A0A0E9QZ21_ANGAN
MTEGEKSYNQALQLHHHHVYILISVVL